MVLEVIEERETMWRRRRRVSDTDLLCAPAKENDGMRREMREKLTHEGRLKSNVKARRRYREKTAEYLDLTL